jgi:hypothetical protein
MRGRGEGEVSADDGGKRECECVRGRALHVSRPLESRSQRPFPAPAPGVTHDLQLDGLAVQLNGADLEVHADGGDVRLRVGVVGCAGGRSREDRTTGPTIEVRGRARRGLGISRTASREGRASLQPRDLHSPKRSSKQLFPTPLSPMRRSLKRKSLHERGCRTGVDEGGVK